MTRICCWCGAVLGEKCSQCGVLLTSEVETLREMGTTLHCSCGHSFKVGEGGVTHGICGPCKAGVPPVLNMMLPPGVLE